MRDQHGPFTSSAVSTIGSTCCCPADSKPLGRQIALFSVVLGLTHWLKRVFVPYYRYLLDPIAAHMGGSTDSAGGDAPRKKRKKRSNTVTVMGDASSDPKDVEDSWRLRLKVAVCLEIFLSEQLRLCVVSDCVALHSCHPASVYKC